MSGSKDEAEAMQGETLLAGSIVRMFGRKFAGLTLGAVGPRLLPGTEQGLARIYGFSWQGNYFKMATPAVFVVSGEGTIIPNDMKGAKIGEIGIDFKDEFFSQDVLMWSAYDVDFSVRIDISSGWLSEILIAAEASDASNMTGSGDGGDTGLATRQSMAARQSVVGRQSMVSRSRSG